MRDPRITAFMAYLKEQARNHSIYVWGGQGQQGSAITEAWIRRRETSQENADLAIAYWQKQVKKGYGNVLRAFDCSGLGMYYLQNVAHILKKDTNANGLYRLCTPVEKKNLRPGDFVFRLDAVTGRAIHVGYVLEGNQVCEARGRRYGVVIRPLRQGNWNAFAHPRFWKDNETKSLRASDPQSLRFF